MSDYYNKIFEEKDITTGDIVLVETKEHTYIGIFGEEKDEEQEFPYQDLYGFFWNGDCEEMGGSSCLLLGKMEILEVKKLGRIDNCTKVSEKKEKFL